MYATVAILHGTLTSHAHGNGQHIDMALLDSQIAMIANMNMNYLVAGRAPRRMGNAHANIVPYQVFDAADGQLVLAVGNDSQFVKFCEAAGCALHRTRVSQERQSSAASRSDRAAARRNHA